MQQKNLKKIFGDNLALYRKQQKETQESLAAKSGVSERTIRYLESGKVGASFDVVEELSQALGVDAWLLFKP